MLVVSPNLNEEFKISLPPPVAVKGGSLRRISVQRECSVFMVLKTEYVVRKIKVFQVYLSLEIHMVDCSSLL